MVTTVKGLIEVYASSSRNFIGSIDKSHSISSFDSKLLLPFSVVVLVLAT